MHFRGKKSDFFLNKFLQTSPLCIDRIRGIFNAANKGIQKSKVRHKSRIMWIFVLRNSKDFFCCCYELGKEGDTDFCNFYWNVSSNETVVFYSLSFLCDDNVIPICFERYKRFGYCWQEQIYYLFVFFIQITPTKRCSG